MAPPDGMNGSTIVAAALGRRLTFSRRTSGAELLDILPDHPVDSGFFRGRVVPLRLSFPYEPFASVFGCLDLSLASHSLLTTFRMRKGPYGWSKNDLTTNANVDWVATDLGATVTIDYRPKGVVCTISAPLARITP